MSLYLKAIVISLYNKKEEKPAKQGVNIHPIMMVNMVLLLITLTPFTRPTPTTAPTMAEDVETGIPSIEKRCMPKAEET